jgi:hypothetical protein
MPTEPSKAEPPKRKRRWYQFSLRTLLVVVTIATVQCAVCLPMLREWQERIEWSDAGGTGSIESALGGSLIAALSRSAGRPYCRFARLGDDTPQTEISRSIYARSTTA